MNLRFLSNAGGGDNPLFLTDASGLWEAYLDGFPDPAARQYHQCSACRRFIQRFGSLATISTDGIVSSAIWNDEDADDLYKPAVAAMAKAVRRAKVTGVFLSSHEFWGRPETGEWRHLSLAPTPEMIHSHALLTAGQKMAEKTEDFRTVSAALAEFTKSHLETALKLLRSDALYRSEKVIGPAEWLHALHVARAAARGDAKDNVVWLAVATAPAGFCHPRSSMIGTLLEDVAAGMNFKQVSERFARKMHPLQYQRPQAAPSAGAIASAEKIFQQLQAGGALARRFCRLDEVQALWRRSGARSDPAGGLFSHLKPKAKGQKASGMQIPAQVMTWEKFQRTVLPTAKRIELLAPERGPYTAFVTAVNANAPPILQWDRDEARNPVSWYFWHGGSTAASFNLKGGRYHEVEAVTLKPSMWNGGFEHQGAGVAFLIADARDTKCSGSALFPEILKSDFHPIRSVIEAHAKGDRIDGLHSPHAAGLMLVKGDKEWDVSLRVWSDGGSLDYRLDRRD